MLKDIIARLVSDRLHGSRYGGSGGKKAWKAWKKHQKARARYGAPFGWNNGPPGYHHDGYGPRDGYGYGHAGGHHRPRGLKGFLIEAVLRHLIRRR